MARLSNQSSAPDVLEVLKVQQVLVVLVPEVLKGADGAPQHVLHQHLQHACTFSILSTTVTPTCS